MRLCFWNDKLICAANLDFDVKLLGHIWLDAPVGYSKLKRYKLLNGVVTEIPVVEYAPKRLKVHRELPLTMDPLISDFSILGFKKTAPHYDRGVKTKSEYLCPIDGDIIVEKIFTDIRDTLTGRLTDLQILFNFYSEDGTLGLSKTQVVRSYDKSQAETEERKRRERAIDFLISEARHTALEPIMDALISHYHTEQLLYKEKGSPDFATAILGETDPTILSYLATQVPFTSNPTQYTVSIKDSILYQLHNIDETQLLSSLVPIV